jgi:hypothetical protein
VEDLRMCFEDNSSSRESGFSEDSEAENALDS